MKRRYRRYFVMLEVEDKSFGIVQNEAPKGYGKIEIKNNQGTLSISCQNLKSGNKISRYRWYLINTKKETEPSIVEVGPMEIDSKGRGEVIWDFNVENVRGSMEEIDNFNVLVLAGQNKDDRKDLYIPLVGYIDKEKSTTWRYALEKHLYIPHKEEKPAEEKEEIKQNDVEPKEVEQKYIEENSVEKEKVEEELVEEKELEEPVKQEKLEEKTEEVIQENTPFQEEISQEEISQEEISQEEVYEHIQPNKEYIPIKDDIDEILEDLNDEESYSLQMQGYIENALKDFPTVNPFVSNLENYNWWQIPYNYQTVYRSYMPFILYIDSVKGPVNYYASKILQNVYLHQHHIFGVLYEESGAAKYYAYGIPGRNHASEQPYEGVTGFTHWYPCTPGPHDMYSPGYWIMLIDPKTGQTIKN